jgi:hypothetical protein
LKKVKVRPKFVVKWFYLEVFFLLEDSKFRFFNQNKHIWCLNKITIKENNIYLFYIFKNQKDKKPLHALYVKGKFQRE